MESLEKILESCCVEVVKSCHIDIVKRQWRQWAVKRQWVTDDSVEVYEICTDYFYCFRGEWKWTYFKKIWKKVHGNNFDESKLHTTALEF